MCVILMKGGFDRLLKIHGEEMKNTHKKRCLWPGTNPLMIAYHDTEWGVPLCDDQKLFEFIFFGCDAGGIELGDRLKEARGVSKGV